MFQKEKLNINNLGYYFKKQLSLKLRQIIIRINKDNNTKVIINIKK